MKFNEPALSGKALIVFGILGSVALLVIGSLGMGSGSYLYALASPNTTSSAVALISGTVIPILFLIGIAMKMI